jgi:hypothetical protein
VKYPDHWDDESANYSSITTDAVKQGKVVPYLNTFEGDRSISYRAKPEATKTWSEDVLDSGIAHPALNYLANNKYNPALTMADIDEKRRSVMNPQLFEADLVKSGTSIAHGSEEEMFGRAQKAPHGSGIAVRRNGNANFGFGRDAAVKATTPRLRPTR